MKKEKQKWRKPAGLMEYYKVKQHIHFRNTRRDRKRERGNSSFKQIMTGKGNEHLDSKSSKNLKHKKDLHQDTL
jgi:hypothetical protein